MNLKFLVGIALFCWPLIAPSNAAGQSINEENEQMKRVRQRMERFRAFGFRRPMDINYAYDPGPLGQYKVVLKVGDHEFTKNASILQDHWYDK